MGKDKDVTQSNYMLKKFSERKHDFTDWISKNGLLDIQLVPGLEQDELTMRVTRNATVLAGNELNPKEVIVRMCIYQNKEICKALDTIKPSMLDGDPVENTNTKYTTNPNERVRIDTYDVRLKMVTEKP